MSKRSASTEFGENHSLRPTRKLKADSYDEFHQPGAVVRVKLKNFVTYNEVELFLGSGLNMITGPNGSGKSSLISALCLGLCGKPEVLGRSTKLGDFVKMGCEKALVEIEVKADEKRGDKKNTVISRIIYASGMSNWVLNGSSVSLKEVQKVVKKFQYQVDNLCQFLPQDKVTSFAQLSPQELLLNTERATGNDVLAEQHQKLIELSSQLAVASASSSSDRSRLSKLKGEQEEDETLLTRIENIKKTRENLQLYTVMFPVARLRSFETRIQDTRKSIEEIEEEIGKKQAESELINARISATETAAEKAGERLAAYKEEKAILKNNLSRVQQLVKSSLEEANAHYESANVDKKKRAYDRKIEGLESRLTQLRSRLKEYQNKKPDEEKLKVAEEESKEIEGEIHELFTKIDEIEDSMKDIRPRYERVESRIDQHKKQLTRLSSANARRMTTLERTDARSSKAVRLFEERKSALALEKSVVLPAMLTIKIRNTECLKQLSAILRKHHVTGFVAQSYKDYLVLSRLLLESRSTDTRVNIFDYSGTTNPTIDTFRSPLSKDKLKDYGFDGYLIDLIEAPDAILTMLCHEAAIHSTPYAANKLTSTQRENVVRLKKPDGSPMFRTFLDGEYITSLFVSRYGRKEITSKFDELRPPMNFIKEVAGAEDSADSEIKNIKREIKKLETQREEIAQREKDEESKKEELNRQLKRKNECIAAYRRRRDEWKTWNQGVEKSKVQIQVAENELENAISARPDFELERRQGISQFDEKVQEAIDQAEAAQKLMDQLIKLEQKIIAATIAERRYVFEFRNLKSLIERELEELYDKRKQMQELFEKDTSMANESRRNLNEKFTSEQVKNAEKELKEKFGTDDETDWISVAEEVKNSKNRISAELELTDDTGIDHGKLLKRFEKRAETIAALQAQIESGEGATNALEQEIQFIRDQWEPELDKLLKSVSNAFSEAFKALGCRGRVDLVKEGENGLDFKKWAINIMVSFRENTDLQLLTSQRQSGGERAVSTVLYLMALQHQTSAPFRVVDEINQGMDGANERMVHKRMVDLACGENNSQYFLVTPKLLPDLHYHPKMKVLCIFSSETVDFHASSETTTRSFLEKIKQKQLTT